LGAARSLLSTGSWLPTSRVAADLASAPHEELVSAVFRVSPHVTRLCEPFGAKCGPRRSNAGVLGSDRTWASRQRQHDPISRDDQRGKLREQRPAATDISERTATCSPRHQRPNSELTTPDISDRAATPSSARHQRPSSERSAPITSQALWRLVRLLPWPALSTQQPSGTTYAANRSYALLSGLG